jgi:Endonuclease NucS
VAYFLIAVSNRENLDLCVRYALAGFTSSGSGLWTYFDINEGDFVSFLYGARVFNLYEVTSKAAYREAEKLPPWPPITFQPSGRTYSFPFRTQLRPIRVLEEQLVRTEFAYVAENLLLRGGYRKTHFQADQTTLQAVSQMGQLSTGSSQTLDLNGAEVFTPLLTNDKAQIHAPATVLFRELFLQAMLRSHLTSHDNLEALLAGTGLGGTNASALEVLSEKAFPEGHIDLLVKEATPMGMSRKVVIEVKRRAGVKADVQQLVRYRATLGAECVGAILISAGSSQRTREFAREEGVAIREYALDFPQYPAPFPELLTRFRIV